MRARISPLMLRVIALTVVTGSIANAHPDDEFCLDEGMDPALCAALAELDRTDSTPADAARTVLEQRSGWKTFADYTRIGVRHIVPGGTDHLLFLAGLLVGAYAWRALFWLITAFTVAHGIALAAVVFGGLNAPSRPVEIAIAATIVWIGVENLFIKPHLAWRYGLVFVFGLIHGLGFAGFLTDIGLPTTQLPAALFGFNLGVELGQLMVVAVTLAAVIATTKAITPQSRERLGRFARFFGSAAVAVVGTLWLAERLLST